MKTYQVKCDECKKVVRVGATLRESFEGCTCDDCKDQIATKIKMIDWDKVNNL